MMKEFARIGIGVVRFADFGIGETKIELNGDEWSISVGNYCKKGFYLPDVIDEVIDSIEENE